MKTSSPTPSTSTAGHRSTGFRLTVAGLVSRTSSFSVQVFRIFSLNALLPSPDRAPILQLNPAQAPGPAAHSTSCSTLSVYRLKPSMLNLLVLLEIVTARL